MDDRVRDKKEIGSIPFLEIAKGPLGNPAKEKYTTTNLVIPFA